MKKLLTIVIASTLFAGCASTTSAPEPNPDLVMYFQPLSPEDVSAIATAKHIHAMQKAKPCADTNSAGHARSMCH